MIKRLALLMAVLVFPNVVLASNNTGAKIGNMYYDNLSDAIEAAKENATIKLLSNAPLEKGIILTKSITIDLNGNTITSPTAVFEVQKGILTIKGKGLMLGKMDNDNEELSIKGEVSAMEYVNVNKDKTTGGILKKLFK